MAGKRKFLDKPIFRKPAFWVGVYMTFVILYVMVYAVVIGLRAVGEHPLLLFDAFLAAAAALPMGFSVLFVLMLYHELNYGAKFIITLSEIPGLVFVIFSIVKIQHSKNWKLWAMLLLLFLIFSFIGLIRLI